MAGATKRKQKWPKLNVRKLEAVNDEQILAPEWEAEVAVKVCGREKKTDVFSRMGVTNEERKPRDPSWALHLPTHTPTSLHVGSFCMSDSLIPGGQNGLSLSLLVCFSAPVLPSLSSICAMTSASQPWF